MRVIRGFAAVLGIFLLLASVAPLAAQEFTATISGTVTDSKGGAIVGAKVTVKDTAKNIVVRTISTDESGNYGFPLLLVGNYELTVEMAGFKKLIKTGIVLNVHDKLTFNLALEIGAVTESVTVTTEALQVELQSASASGLVTETEIKELPLGTRVYEELVTLMPGVSSGAADSMYIGTTNPVGGTNVVSFSMNGQRNSANNWTVDGADNVDRGSNLTLLTYPSVDAIAEFKVSRTLYDAGMGRAGASQVTVITKSGASRFHGSAYEFFRNDVLQANNFLNNSRGIARPPLRYNDFGYTIGGPVFIPGGYNTARDKTFFFFSQEIRRVTVYGTTTSSAIPTLGMLDGTFLNPVCLTAATCTLATAVTQIDPATFNPVAVAYINDIFSKLPAPNSGTFNLITPLQSRYKARQELARVDHIFSPKLSLAIRYIHDTIPTEEPGGLFTGLALPGVASTKTNSPGYSWMVRATSTITPRFLNEGGFVYSYGAILSDITGTMSKANSPDIQLPLPYPVTIGRVPAMTFQGGNSLLGFGPYLDYNRNYNAFDNVTWIRGPHSFRVGASYNYYQKTENAGGVNAGQFGFTGGNRPSTATSLYEQSWANFLLGRAATFTQAKSDLTPDIRESQIEIFALDEYRVKPNLTVNIGVRYSRFGQPVDNNKYLSNFDPRAWDPNKAPTMNLNGTLCLSGTCTSGIAPNPNYDPLNGIIIGGQTSPYGLNVSNQNNKNFAPRIGVAWDPFKNGKTSIRAGYGMFYDSTLVGTYEQNVFGNPPFSPNVTVSNVTLGSNFSAAAATSVLSLRGTALPSHTPYSQQWSLDIQRHLFPSLMVDVGYYGGNGVHLLGIMDINQIPVGDGVAAGLLPVGTTIFTTTTSTPLNILRPYRGYNAINVVQNGFNSNYNSLQVSAKKTFKGNSLFNVYYTYSHALTNNQSDRSNAPQNSYNIHGDYSPSALDRRHILTANLVYAAPWYKDQKGLVGYLAGGWQISGIISYYTGLPLTVTTSGVDPGGLGFLGASAAGGRPDLVGDPNANAPHSLTQFFNTAAFALVPNGTVRPGNAGRGVVIGPGMQRWNAALSRKFKLPREAMYLQFRAEYTNLFNHTNFAGVGTALTTASTFGTVTSVRDARVGQLSLKFIF